MTAFNVVRFRPKAGEEEEFERRFTALDRQFDGLIRFSLVKSDKGTYFSIAEWKDLDSMAGARPRMIANLDRFRSTLDEIGNGMGVTDPVSGTVIFEDLGPESR